MRTETRSTCPYCGVGCGVIIEAEAGQITGVRGDPDHPANAGRLCSKGSTLHLSARAPLQAHVRILQPQYRPARGEPLQPISWDDAMTRASDRLAAIIAEQGPDAVGFYGSGQLLTEDYYVLNKLVKGLIGTNNLDTNSRLCMSSAVAAYRKTLGADAPPACYDDLDQATCLFIAGSNTAHAHPILFRRIEDARARNPALRIIVVDPRRTDTASFADLHLAIEPGTDVLLFHGMLHVMLWEGWADTRFIEQHTSGFDALKALVRTCPPEEVARVCGITPAQLAEAARAFACSRATLSLYCQGLNQSTSGTAKNAALINLHLTCAQIGRPGAGPFSLTGQPNAMGGREVGAMANLLSGHRDLARAADREEVASFWGVPDVPERPGKTAVEMFQAAADGEIRALWIACTNPAQSMPDQRTVRRALERAELVVVQEAFASAETCSFADLLLPATTWGEKSGTVTNSERRISRVHGALPAPGQARHDWQIFSDLAQRLAATESLRRRGRHPVMNYADPEQIWNEHRELTRGRDLDITGLSYARLERSPVQWPCTQADQPGQARLYEDFRFATPDGRARFSADAYTPVAEEIDARHPFSLTTGRLRDQWHGMTRTGLIARLFGHVPEPVVQMQRGDMTRLGLAEGDLAHVTSRRGSVLIPVQGSEELKPGHSFIAMHWGSAWLSGRDHQGRPLAGVNAITQSAFCPGSKQPELKHAAVRILKADLRWQLMAMAWMTPEAAHTAARALRQSMSRFEFASCVPFAALGARNDEGEGLLFRAASSEPPEPSLLERIEGLMGLPGVGGLRYIDAGRGQLRSLRIDRDSGATLSGFVIAGEGAPARWLEEFLRSRQPVAALGRTLLRAGPRPPVALPPVSKAVCTCVGVSAEAIRAELLTIAKAGAGDTQNSLPQLQARLGCGTQCGSCLPELRRMVVSAQS